MGDANHIRTLRDYSKPSHEGYRNNIELFVWNNVDLSLYNNESWNDLRDFAKPVKAISLPQDVPSTSHRCLIELECLMEAHLALTQPTQVNKITTSCGICSVPHDTLYCMKDPEQAFVEYASSRTNKTRGKGVGSALLTLQGGTMYLELMAYISGASTLGFSDQEKEDYVNSTNNVNVASTNGVNTVSENISNELPFEPDMPALEDISTFNSSSDHKDDDEEADMNNMGTTIQVSHVSTIRVHKDHPLDQVIGDLHLTTQTRNMSKNLE
nr:hypothetical protein [Tanacetum cinerariifolium]